MGIFPIIYARPANWCSLSSIFPEIGVLIGPGVMVLTRMERGANSAAKVGPKERRAALVAL